MNGFFITGTDTGIGKTTFACLLLDLFSKKGYTTLGLKPVATGCYHTQNGNRNKDAKFLRAHSTLKLPYDQINPIALIPPTSPNIAAKFQKLSVNKILEACKPSLERQVDYLIIEGAGGWKVPINSHETMADLALSFKLPVIVVVGMRLGCINHTLLTIDSIQRSGAKVVGWISNEIELHHPFLIENQETISQHVNVPMLGSIKFREKQRILDLKQSL